VLGVCKTGFVFETYEDVQPYYARMINTLKQMNYTEFLSNEFKQYESQLNSLVEERKVK